MTRFLSSVEKILINRLLEGDALAFSIIFSAYYKDLVMFAMKFTRELADAEDIVQEIFVKLWEDHEVIHIHSSLKSYLLKSVQNKSINWLKHKKIISIYSSNARERSTLFENSTDNYLLQSELQEQIDKALAKLPGKMSEAFRMNRYKGMKYKEISKVMNVSERTIEVYIGKALASLRNYLKDYFS